MDNLDTSLLPPNWEQKYDPRTGRYYFVNIYTKAPPHLSSESIPVQPLYGSPRHIVYPIANLPVQHGFQNSYGVPSESNSPQFNIRQHQIEMTLMPKSAPHTPKLSQNGGLQETSFSQVDVETMVLNIQKMFPYTHETRIRTLLKKYHNREAVVISALQVERHPLTTPGPYTPPPSTRNFHKAATACMAAFQLTPRDRSSSPAERSGSAASGTYSMGHSYGSPRFEGGFRMSPKPHSSPKMKLRYVKGLFPKAEETIILDVLANVDNNVQKASDRLIIMGYQKRDMISANKIALKKKEDEKEEREKLLLNSTKPIKVKSMEEKKKLKIHLQNKFKSIPEKVICMALESVEFSEDKAIRILNIVMQEDNIKSTDEEEKQETKHEVDNSEADKDQSLRSATTTMEDNGNIPPPSIGMKASESNATTAVIDQSPSQSTLLFVAPASSSSSITSSSSDSASEMDGHNNKRSKSHNLKNSPSKLILVEKIVETGDAENNHGIDYAAALDESGNTLFKSCATGANPKFRKGPNDELLLADYLLWNGANPDLNAGRNVVSRGPNTSMLSERKYIPRGPNKDLCKGPSTLAKGSAYTHDVICI